MTRVIGMGQGTWKGGAVLVAILLVVVAGAAVNMADVTVDPDEELWLSQEFDIEATCEDTDETYEVFVENVTRDGTVFTAGPDDLGFQKDEGTYFLRGSVFASFIEESDTFRSGKYTMFVGCQDGDDTDWMQHSFTVKTLEMNLLSDIPDTAYAGDELQWEVELTEEGETSSIVRPSHGPEFSVSNNFDTDRNLWRLTIPVPDETGTQDLSVTAEHDGATATETREIDVQDTIQFAATVDRSQVSPGSTVELTTEAIHRGDRLALDQDDIDITFDGDTINDRVTTVDATDDGSTFTIDLPELHPGAYDLNVELDREDTPDAEETVRIDHPVPVTGAFLDADSNPISYEMLFDRDDETVDEISGDGAYDTALTPGEYNVTMLFDGAELWFQDTVVDDWDDIVRYRSYADTGTDTDAAVPGLTVAGLYAYRTGLDYDLVELALDYDAGDLDDPDDVAVYFCDAWNMDRADCYGSWERISATFDDVDTTAYVTGREGAYVIGEHQQLSIRHSSGDIGSAYTPDDELSFSGLVRDENDDRVENASVTMNVDGTDISDTARTGDDGTFTFAFTVPDEDGEYTVELGADGDLYDGSASSFTFDVERPASIDIVTPQNIGGTANTTEETTFYVENTGYTTIDLEPRMDIPFLRDIELDADGLSSGENREGTIIMDIPENVSTDTHTAELGFAFEGQEQAETFGVTVEALEQEQKMEENESVTTVGMISRSLPSVSGVTDAVSVSGVVPDTDSWLRNAVLGIILIQAGIVVVVVARGRIGTGGLRRTERDDVLRTVNDIKSEVGQQRQVEAPVASAAARWRNDGVERDHVLRTMSHIKQQIGQDQ